MNLGTARAEQRTSSIMRIREDAAGRLRARDVVGKILFSLAKIVRKARRLAVDAVAHVSRLAFSEKLVPRRPSALSLSLSLPLKVLHFKLL